MRPPPIIGQPVQPASDQPTFTLFTADSTDAAELLDTVPCELMSLTLAVASDPSLGLVSGITSTGGNGSPSTLTPSSESLLNSFSRTSVLFVS
uniref:Uncharacterized protein n=1 Tax=Romanomermis culicivorax TaxID=13658 RepID=A0A915IFK8_ROMCU